MNRAEGASGATKAGAPRSEFSAFHHTLSQGKTSCEELVREELKNARRYNKRLNAFVTLFDGEHGIAIARARALDALGRRGGELQGVPLAIKDNIFFGGFRTTDATFYFKDFVPSRNAELVDRALARGGIPLGKTNLHEIALGATSAASYFGPVRNPRDPSRVSGGSSGGSAVAVAMSKGPLLGFGTDTGGSIRVPAALCGIVGFKPTLGALPLDGIFPLSATLDHAGLLTRTVPDMLLAFGCLGQADRERKTKGRRGTRVGVLTGHFFAETEKRVSKNFWTGMERMESSDRFSVVEVPTDSSFERFTRARAAIQLKEAAWFFDGLMNDGKVAAKMNPDVLTLLRRGAKVGQVGYMAAESLRLESIRVFGRMLKEVDLLAMPTTRAVAPKLDDVRGKEAGRLRRVLLQNTEVFNLCGFPALSVPSNPGSADLPTAIQLVCGLGEDEKLLRSGEEASVALSGAS